MRKIVIALLCSALVTFSLGIFIQKRLQKPTVNTIFSSDPEKARGTAIHFLASLFEKDYAEAASVYGGDYSQLLDWNPDIRANDKPALWQRGCEQNGLNCLEVRNAAFASQPNSHTSIINVWFSNADKITEFQSTDGRSMFPFTVIKTDSGAYQVMTMPVYTP